jgi:hypothetical protein
MTTICESTQAVKKEEEEVITSNEIRLAIRRAFPNQTGKMIIHQVSDVNYRVNWHDENAVVKNAISRSAFVLVSHTPDGLQVVDRTHTSTGIKPFWR